VVVDWTDISLLDEFGGENLGKLLSKDNYEQIFSKLGINADSEVLVYGFTMPEQGFGDEARVVYTFNYAGFDKVKFIDGGFKQVEKLGFNKNYEPTEDRLDVSDVVRSEATQNEKAIFTDELLSKLGSNDVQIIDTRLEFEFNGRVIYGENKAGHIPGAISLPFNSLVDNNGFLKSREELEKLPGVGRKTANVVLSVGFNIPAIAVDTHVERVAKMFGLADINDSPLQVEKNLMSVFPMESWGKIHHQLIHLGRYKLPARGERSIDPELEKLLVLK